MASLVSGASARRATGVENWVVEPLTDRFSAQAGALVKRVLETEFAQTLTLCADGDLDDMAGAYKRPGCEAWVARAGGRVIGVIAAKETPDGAIKIKRFYVDAQWRGLGVGRALHDAADAWIEGAGYQQVVLTTTEWMAHARAFYAVRGYAESGRTQTESGVLHHYRRALVRNALGARIAADDLPPHGDDELGVIVERPRGFVEGWHWDRARRQLVLAEVYDRPVPVNYGFAPEWENSADGEALDVIVVDDRRMRPGESLTGRPVGVLWRADADHKLLVEPTGGADRPILLDEAYRKRVSSWWPAELQPSGWGGPESVERLLVQCRRRKGS